MFCRHCGKQIPDDVNFCVYCGQKVDVPSEWEESSYNEHMGTQGTNAGRDTYQTNAAHYGQARTERLRRRTIITVGIVIPVLALVAGLTLFILFGQHIGKEPKKGMNDKESLPSQWFSPCHWHVW